MSTKLPTKPGPYYWRESDGDEWEHIFVMDPGNGHLYGHDGVVATSLHDWEQDYGAVGQWLTIPTAEELVELQAKAKAYDEGQKVFMTFDKHDRVRHLGDLKDYGRLVHMLRSELDSIVYTCRKVRVCKEVER